MLYGLSVARRSALLPAANYNSPSYLDGGGSRFVSGSSLLFHGVNLGRLGLGTGIAQRQTDSPGFFAERDFLPEIRIRP